MKQSRYSSPLVSKAVQILIDVIIMFDNHADNKYCPNSPKTFGTAVSTKDINNSLLDADSTENMAEDSDYVALDIL